MRGKISTVFGLFMFLTLLTGIIYGFATGMIKDAVWLHLESSFRFMCFVYGVQSVFNFFFFFLHSSCASRC